MESISVEETSEKPWSEIGARHRMLYELDLLEEEQVGWCAVSAVCERKL